MQYKVSKIKLSPDVATHKIKSWCAYQERSQSETLQKLKSFGIQSHEAESILADLISENFVNEERFARSLASGKFRIKHWGKIKIKMALREHGVSEHNITLALASINDNEYLETIDKLLARKINSLTEKTNATQILLRYLLSRGFEPELVNTRIKNIAFNG